jgi:pimeloyl-ACP methyl ester carboxylesterase
MGKVSESKPLYMYVVLCSQLRWTSLLNNKYFFRLSLVVILWLCFSSVSAKSPEDDRSVMAKSTDTVIRCPKHSFQQYQTKDSLGRDITFYISEPLSTRKAVPLVVYINGSGGDSVFSKDKRGNVQCSPAYDTLLRPMQNRARLLIVEKPGVKLFAEAKPFGTMIGCSEEFLREYTLDRWTEAINAAIAAGRSLPGIDQDKLLVVGHSEGGQVAPHVAAKNPKVTHVANLAGGGPTQLFEMMIFAQEGARQQHKTKNHADEVASSTKATDEIIRQWKEMQADKDSFSKFWNGHTYKRWYSFCANSPIDDLLNCSAKAYLVQGTADTSTPVVSFDVMQAVLLAHNRPFVAERIDGANHGLKIMHGKTIVCDRRPEVMARIVNWFLALI